MIDKNKLPQHISVIMDGNGRWANERGKARVFGHRNGVKSVREITEACAELGIKYLTLYAFSTENWGRPSFEVSALMGLLVETLKTEVATLNKNNIRLLAIGDLSGLPKRTLKALKAGIEATAGNDHMTLVLALNYSARWDLTNAVQQIATKTVNGEMRPDEINEETLSQHLSTYLIPDPELIIRSSGEQRLSNFLLWESAYSEFYFTPVFWPDFKKENLHEAIEDFQHRKRRFGKVE
jgi:undecaprenyl diphosphate synthase